MSIYSPAVQAYGNTKKDGMKGFFDSVNVGTRLFNPELANRARRNIAQQAAGIGTGQKNAILDMLRSRGLGRSGKTFGAAGAGASAQGDFLNKYQLGFDLGEQDFTEGARRFDTATALALKNMFLQRKKDEESQFGLGDIFGSLLGGAAQVGSAYAGKG